MITNDLHDGWTVRAVAGPIPAEVADRELPAVVPGTAHTDLLAAGLIPDPYLGVHETALAWMHRAAWLYRTTLHAAPPAEDERVDLVFDGLDTVATVRLGEHEVGRTANMHRDYRFDVRSLLTGEDLDLSVRFDSALEYAEAMRDRLGARPHTNFHPYNMVRKMACSFGWDWGPDLQTAGIWKPVRLERWRVARFAEVRLLTTKDSVTAHVTVERSGLQPDGDLLVRVDVLGVAGEVSLAASDSTCVVEIAVPDAPTWWPAGFGDQPLFPVTVTLEGHDEVTRRVGFRTVTLDETPDDVGSRFTIVVNGREIFALGLNWIPEDHLLTRLTRADYEAAIDRAVAANANLLRVWGGGIFESDDFYDVCDERGVLVWQDFLLACAAYPEEEPLRSEILAETRENVARLSSHPSLAVWNGGNENIWGHEDWAWKPALGELTWGAGYYYDEFPALLAELDPARPYHPGSPSSPGQDPAEVHPNDDRFGTRHEWQAWNTHDYTWHDNFVPRFCSEFGWQAPPTWATLTSALEPADLRQDSPAFLLHQKAADGNDKLNRGLAHHLPIPDDFADWHWATQLNQAHATTYAVEHLRAHRPRTMGSVLWQLNDCWPVTSWAVVDGAGRLKPAWFALRRAYAPRLLTFQGAGLVAVNDTDDPWESTVHFWPSSTSAAFSVPPRSVASIPVGPAELVADADGLRAVSHTEVKLDPAPFTAVAEQIDGGWSVTVTASALARDVSVLADALAPDATVDQMLITLLPGETTIFRVRTQHPIAPEDLTGPAVLRSANALFAPAATR